MNNNEPILAKECPLCLGWGLKASRATYLEWEKQLEEAARQFHEFENKNTARLFHLKMKNLQLLLKSCFHCDGTGFRTLKIA